VNNERLVDGPSHARYLVRVTREGVHRFSLIGGLPNLLAVLFTWCRYLARSERPWAVEVRPGRLSKYPVLLEEHFEAYADAAARADVLVDEILDGLVLDAGGDA